MKFLFTFIILIIVFITLNHSLQYLLVNDTPIVYRSKEVVLTSYADSSAVTGSQFTMDKKRLFTDQTDDNNDNSLLQKITTLYCTKWIILLSSTSRANRTIPKNYCIIIVAMNHTSQPWCFCTDKCVFLSFQQQRLLPYSIIGLTPINHISRKNIGYLYAIHHGATEIYDYDQIYEDIIPHRQYDLETNSLVINPYDLFNISTHLWPRGYPIDYLKIKTDYSITISSNNTIGSVIHLFGGTFPDLDSICHQVKPEKYSHKYEYDVCYRIRSKSFIPWNSKSSVIFYQAFWSLMLPHTVESRVSDIWRAYLNQKIMWENNMLISVCPLEGTQNNGIKLEKYSLNMELPLYTKVLPLLDYLIKVDSPCTKGLNCMIDMYVDMYERGIVERDEVKYSKLWFNDLEKIGYF